MHLNRHTSLVRAINLDIKLKSNTDISISVNHQIVHGNHLTLAILDNVMSAGIDLHKFGSRMA